MVAVLGAGGTMGFAMAQNLLRDGFTVRAWNRTFEKAEPLAAGGAELAESPAAAVNGADAVITMVSDANAVIATMDGGGALHRVAGRGGGHEPLQGRRGVVAIELAHPQHEIPAAGLGHRLQFGDHLLVQQVGDRRRRGGGRGLRRRSGRGGGWLQELSQHPGQPRQGEGLVQHGVHARLAPGVGHGAHHPDANPFTIHRVD